MFTYISLLGNCGAQLIAGIREETHVFKYYSFFSFFTFSCYY